VQERRTVAPLGPAGSGDNRVRRRYGVVAIVAATILALDQLTKWWALRTLDDRTIDLVGSLRLALTFNKAGAFGLGSSFVPVLAVFAVAVVLLIVVRGETNTQLAVAIALGMVLGGAFGNLADRLFRAPGLLRGAVVDFIDLQWWPVFNLADAAITCGCVLLVLTAGRRPAGA
jgi:signal peptidase II